MIRTRCADMFHNQLFRIASNLPCCVVLSYKSGCVRVDHLVRLVCCLFVGSQLGGPDNLKNDQPNLHVSLLNGFNVRRGWKART